MLRVLKERFDGGSRPGARTDAFKLGLVVEGGGMRGAVTGGALMALLDLDARHCFDAVYGTCNLADGLCIPHVHYRLRTHTQVRRLGLSMPHTFCLASLRA